MKRPKLPENPNFWLSIAKNEEQVQLFLKKGNRRQKRNLIKALRLLKWNRIQKEKEQEDSEYGKT